MSQTVRIEPAKPRLFKHKEAGEFYGIVVSDGTDFMLIQLEQDLAGKQRIYKKGEEVAFKKAQLQ